MDHGVHANGVARARFHAQTTNHAAKLVDFEDAGPLLDAAVRRLFGNDGNAVGWAHRRTHHARHAADFAVVAFHQSVQAAIARRIRLLFLGIRKRGDLGLLAPAKHVADPIVHQVTKRHPKSLRDTEEVGLPLDAGGTRDYFHRGCHVILTCAAESTLRPAARWRRSPPAGTRSHGRPG